MSSKHPKVSVKKGREFHVQRGHPWLFSGSISQAPKGVEAGAIVTLVDYEGRFVATGYYNESCDIAVRILSRDAEQQIDKNLLESRIQSAWNLRKQALDFESTNVFRLVNAEGDLLPGFIVDYYAGVVVIQCHTAGADALLDLFVDAIEGVISPSAIIIRNDASVRHREGLATEESRIARGKLEGDLIVKENGLKFVVDPISGQKTGFFTDQRDKRRAIAEYAARLPEGSTLFNCFSYTCSFSVYAAAANSGIHTVNVDQSQPALDQGSKNFTLNSLPLEKHEFVNADAFTFMDRQVARGTKYDIAILDPPAFAKSHKDKPKALKGYARMTSLGLRLVKPGGLIVLCSCSGAITLDEFTDCIRQTAGASERSVQILEVFQHGCDHPLNAMASEGAYLKVLLCRVAD